MADDEDDRVDELIAQLRDQGHRATVARRAVLEAIVAAGDTHLTSEELAQRIHRTSPDIHLSTIYRTLDTLSDAGLVTIARFGDQPVTHHLATDVHHHAVCSSCGATHRVPPSALESLRRRLLADYGFEADPRHLTITGRCRSCAHQP